MLCNVTKVWSAHFGKSTFSLSINQSIRKRSRHAVVKNEMQPPTNHTTNNRAICVSSSERRHCETLLAYHWTRGTSPRGWTPPLGYLLLSLCNDRSRFWTACWSAVLPVGGLQRPCRNHLFSSFWGLAGSDIIYVETREISNNLINPSFKILS